MHAATERHELAVDDPACTTGEDEGIEPRQIGQQFLLGWDERDVTITTGLHPIRQNMKIMGVDL
jgi:hypothetical protein